MIRNNFSNLTGKILVASPHTMHGSMFHESLVYVTQHGEKGSAGFILNRSIDHNMSLKKIIKKSIIDTNDNLLGVDVLIGGPVEIERAFILHSSEYDKNLLFKSKKIDFAISSNSEIMKDINSGTGPKQTMFAIGYTRWEAGQIEDEMQHNLWMPIEENEKLIFKTETDSKWAKAIDYLGINTNHFIPHAFKC